MSYIVYNLTGSDIYSMSFIQFCYQGYILFSCIKGIFYYYLYPLV